MSELTNRLILGAILAGCCLWPALPALLSSASISGHHTAPYVQPGVGAEGLYYGTSRGASGTRAWLLWLDAPRRRGALYAVPGTVALRDVRVASAGAVSFQTESFDVVYKFEGTFRDNKLIGEFTVRPPVAPPTRDGVSLSRQSLPQPNSLDWEHSGLYSNGFINDQSGDLNGMEMIVLNTSPVLGAYVRFDQPYVPHALLNTVRTRNGFGFTVRAEGTETKYSVVYQGKELVLRRTSPPGGRAVVLQRRKSITAAFQ